MTRVATAGMASCATIAINNFKNGSSISPFKNKDMNEAYKVDPTSWEGPDGMSVKDFYDDILYPTEQELAQTADYPFRALIKAIDNSPLQTKLIITALNDSQEHGGYWKEELLWAGFEKVDKTKNEIGSMNHIYARSPNRPDSVPNRNIEG